MLAMQTDTATKSHSIMYEVFTSAPVARVTLDYSQEDYNY